MTRRVPVNMLADEGAPNGHVPQVLDGAMVLDAVPDPGAVALSPTASISAVKDSGNPTLTETGSMPENIIEDGGLYWMLYSRRVNGSYTRLHLAYSDSPKGPWTPYGGNPVLITGSQAWEAANITNGGCLVKHDGIFYIFYAVAPDVGKIGAIGVATASAVTGPYTKYASNPILPLGAAGAWDSLRVQEPDVKVLDDGTWVMAYMGETTAAVQGASEKIGIATAIDPLGPWTKSASNPVIGFGAAGEFDVGGAADPSLLYENGVLWCLYSGLQAAGGKPWQLGLAYADIPDGPWTKHADNPILTVGGAGAFDEKAVWRGALFRRGSTYHVPYGGIPSSGQSYDAKGGNARLVVSGGGQPIDAHESDPDPHPQYLTQAEGDARYLDQTEGDARYVRTVNGVAPDGTGNVSVSSSSGQLLERDGLTPPLVFSDLLTNEAQDTLLYSD